MSLPGSSRERPLVRGFLTQDGFLPLELSGAIACALLLLERWDLQTQEQAHFCEHFSSGPQPRSPLLVNVLTQAGLGALRTVVRAAWGTQVRGNKVGNPAHNHSPPPRPDSAQAPRIDPFDVSNKGLASVSIVLLLLKYNLFSIF